VRVFLMCFDEMEGREIRKNFSTPVVDRMYFCPPNVLTGSLILSRGGPGTPQGKIILRTLISATRHQVDILQTQCTKEESSKDV